jgi:hypothetical protein
MGSGIVSISSGHARCHLHVTLRTSRTVSQGSIAATTTLSQEAFVKWAVSQANYALCGERIEAFWNSLER